MRSPVEVAVVVSLCLLPSHFPLILRSWFLELGGVFDDFASDPELWVGWGQNTTDEMAIGWTDFIYISEEEYETILAEREAAEEKRHLLSVD